MNDVSDKINQLETILKRMWVHDNDGSELFPVPNEFWWEDKWGHTGFSWKEIIILRDTLKSKDYIHNVNEYILFDIMHKEIFPLIDEIKKMIK